jgi:Domain of unknown function (DUF4105)
VRVAAAALAVMAALAPCTSVAAIGAQVSTAPTVAAQLAPVDTLPGSELDVYVMTMGQGDLLWERFGHNALGIRNRRLGTDVVYNWGMFSFEQPGFLPRFLRGEMRYWMAPFDAAQTLLAYQQYNRSVSIQWLNLSAQQKDSIRRFVEWNALDANKFYRYDYYRDNCSTRVRDVLDLVLGGAIRRATEPQATTMSYRDHSLRLMDGMFWTRTGMDLGLGTPTDRPISRWEAMFVPMEMQRALRELRIPDASGALVPLVRAEEELFVAQRAPERMDVPRLALGALMLGLVVAAIALVVGFRTPGRLGALLVTTSWSAVIGVFGLLLALLWVATEHVAAHRNQNLLFVQPLWLAVALLMPFIGRRRSARSLVLLAVRISAVLTAIGAVVALTGWRQHSGAIAAFTAPVNLVTYVLVLRLVHLAQQEANRDRELNARRSARSRKP